MKSVNFVFVLALMMLSFSPFEKETEESKDGRKSYVAGDMENAKEEFLKATERLENNAQAYYNLGNALQKSNDNEGAVNAYRKSLETGQADSTLKSYIFHNMGNSMAALGKYSDAEKFYIRSLMENPQDDTAENLEIVRRIIEEQQKKDEEKQDEQKQDEQKQDEQKQDEQKQDEQKQDEQKQDEQKQDEQNNKPQSDDQEQPDQEASQIEEKEKDSEEKEEGKESLIKQFKERKNLQISPFMLRKEERSKNGQTW